MRSLSNVIKSYVVRYEEAAVKTIDNHLRKEAEIQVRRNLKLVQSKDEDGFVEGIQATIVEPLNEEEDHAKTAEKVLASAREEAKIIIEKAMQEAEQIKVETLSKARKQGYNEGIEKSQKELKEKQKLLETERLELIKEYEIKVARLEPEMADIMANLIEKLTGILMEDHKEVIQHLVGKAFQGLDKIDWINLRVGQEDYEFLLTKKEQLIEALGRNIPLDIIEDPGLRKNQCLIETELKVIDCSLNVQLSNLITDLKLLGNI